MGEEQFSIWFDHFLVLGVNILWEFRRGFCCY